MSALVTSFPASASRYEFVEAIGDAMEPTLRGGHDLVLAVPVDRYCGEGLYVLDYGSGDNIVRCDRVAGKSVVRVMQDNPVIRGWREVDLARFGDLRPRFVVADIRVRDRRAMRTIVEGRAA